ncbi:TraR/DksA C4-type zinc finger protein [Pantoea sp. KPR_PJ]|uniref:TraR/DksA C4-type zinc finger protein n=1 Tax=Pantoea sp. KPR_PJ TaxID=2738375 RepID=UPI003528E141
MADIIDEASAAIERTEDAEVAIIRNRLTGPGRSTCENCGEAIPAARRELLPSVTTCITCQEILELRQRTGQIAARRGGPEQDKDL